MNWYLKCLKQYADFSGRARRKEFWMFALFNFIFGSAAMIIDNVLGLTFEFELEGLSYYGPFYLLYALGVFIPNLAVGVRRLHDIDKSGWWFLIALSPLVSAIPGANAKISILLIAILGPLWLLVWWAKYSSIGENQYGEQPEE
jgi:uncharacterized membrane protein YhaH (DUF805 family)